MNDLNLDRLTETRDGVRIKEIELRRTSEALSEEILGDAGLAALLRGRIYALPETITRGEPLLQARYTKADDLANWSITIGRLPAAEPPADVISRSSEVGGIAGLLRRISVLWTSYGRSDLLMLVEYELQGHKTRLLRTKGAGHGAIRATQVGAYWNIEGAEQLAGMSIVKAVDGLLVTVLSRVASPGWPDVAAHEARLWHDVWSMLTEAK